MPTTVIAGIVDIPAKGPNVEGDGARVILNSSGLDIGDIDIIGLFDNPASPRSNLRFVAGRTKFGPLQAGDNMGGLQWLPNFRGTNAQISVDVADGSTVPSCAMHFFITRVGNGGGVEVLRLDPSAVAGDTPMLLYDVSAGTLKRVSVGVADSGGVGFKVLRVPN